MKNNIKLFIFCFVLFTFPKQSFALEKKLLLFNLGDQSGYRGSWKIKEQLTKKLAQKLRKKSKITIIRKNFPNKKKIGFTIKQKKKILNYARTNAQANLILIGTIKKFEITRFSITSYGIGGWDNYTAVCNIEYEILSKTNVATSTPKIAEKIIQNHNIGIALLGGPGSPGDIGDVSIINQLEKKIDMNSDQFYTSIIGGACSEALDQIVDDFFQGKKQNNQKNSSINFGKVVDLDKETVYINLGKNNNLFIGQQFTIYQKSKPIIDQETNEYYGNKEKEVAIIEIQRILSKNLSKAKIIKRFDNTKIKIGQEIEFYEQ